MEVSTRWNKKIFSLLLEKAKGDRSLRQFAFDCDISYVQMRKLVYMVQENPPRPKLIKKIANAAWNEVDLEDLLYAAGIFPADARVRDEDESSPAGIAEKVRNLSPKSRKSAEDYINYLLCKESEK